LFLNKKAVASLISLCNTLSLNCKIINYAIYLKVVEIMSQFDISIKNLKYFYKNKKPVLDIELLEIATGSKVFLYGPSGCGKTTLLSIIAGIINVQHGSVKIFDIECVGLKAAKRDALRANYIGYIFQMFNLIPYLNVKDNILLPSLLNESLAKNIHPLSVGERCNEITHSLNIHNLLTQKVTELSIGQQQRVAAARALLGYPKLLICDEPTSALDMQQKEFFLNKLFAQCEKQQTTLVVVSHDQSLKSYFNKQIYLPEINRVVQ
jgi:putative ABC transport system ATP-binding protein